MFIHKRTHKRTKERRDVAFLKKSFFFFVREGTFYLFSSGNCTVLYCLVLCTVLYYALCFFFCFPVAFSSQLSGQSVVFFRNPLGSCVVCTRSLSLEVAASGNKTIRSKPDSQAVLITVGRSSPFMRLAEHLTLRFALGASSVCAWLVITRRAPPWHCRDARVYGHTTKTIHDV